MVASDSVFCCNYSKVRKMYILGPVVRINLPKKMFSILNINPKVAKWKLNAKLVPEFWFLILVLVSVSVRVCVRNVN